MNPRKYWALPDRFSGDVNFRVEGLAVHEEMPPDIVNRPHGIGDWWLLMMFYQETEVLAEGGIQTCPRHGLVVWPPGGHRYGCPGRRWDHTWIHCTGTMVGAIVGESGVPTNRVLLLPDPSLFEQGLGLIHGEVQRHRPPDPVILCNLFENVMRELHRSIVPNVAATVVPARLLKVKEYLDGHFAETLTLEDLARRATLSVPHFSREFRRCFQVSPVDYLIRLRMMKAQYLLLDEHLNITEVAARVGYGNLYYFSRLFKQHFGHSPRELRRVWRQGREGGESRSRWASGRSSSSTSSNCPHFLSRKKERRRNP